MPAWPRIGVIGPYQPQRIAMRRPWNVTSSLVICLLCAVCLLATPPEAAAQRRTDKFVTVTEINLALREDRFADVLELTTVALHGRVSAQGAAQLHFARSRGEMGLHDLKDCRADVEEAIKLDPTMKDAYAARAWFAEQDAEWAKAAADRAVALSGKDPEPEKPARACL